MSFKTSNLTIVSALTLSAVVSTMSGCSSIGNGSSQASSSNAPAISQDNASFDSYYGSPSTRQHEAKYQPKVVHKVTKPIFKYNAPKRYVVKKGDTLWAISNMFLNNPAYWPEIWDKNQKIANPHRIYPGDVLYIYQGGRKKIRIADGSVVEKLVPQIRIERNGGGKPISTLAPFLVWPHVLDEDTIKNAPYIVDARDANILIEKNMTVYVKNLADRHAGGRYAIVRKGKMLKDPETGQKYGYEVVYNGFLEVEQPAINVEVATATVEESKREIKRGDRLLYVEDETHKLDAPITVPKHKVRGSIISLFDAEMISAQTQVVTINQGARNGIKTGYTLGVYTPGKKVSDPYQSNKQTSSWKSKAIPQVSIPPVRAATAIVYKVLDNISYALITESENEVKNGYKIGNP